MSTGKGARGVKLLKRILAAALGCLLLSACTPITTNVEELLAPPQLSQEQKALYDTLKDYVGQAVQLKYPASGEYRSPFIFLDLNGDGSNEAIVLYGTADSSTAWIGILCERDGKWEVGNLVSGAGQDVDFIRSDRVTPGDAACLTVGWSQESAQEKRLVVYRYAEGTLAFTFESVYSQVAVGSFIGDGLTQLVVISPSSLSRTTVKLVSGATGTVEVASTVYLSAAIQSVLTPVTGRYGDGTASVVLDCYTDAETLTTVALQISGRRLNIVWGGTDEQLAVFSRSQAVLSADIDGDGAVELPSQRRAPGYEDAAGDAAMYLTDYRHILPGGDPVTVLSAFVNLADGYRFALPDAWASAEGDHRVSLSRQQENGEIIFFIYNNSIYNHGSELLRLRINKTQDYQDKFDTDRYFLLARRGTFEYYAALPTVEDPDLGVSKETVTSNFSLIG